jgi:hypothetical protein
MDAEWKTYRYCAGRKPHLLKHGANPHVKTNYGETPASAARDNQHNELAAILEAAEQK